MSRKSKSSYPHCIYRQKYLCCRNNVQRSGKRFNSLRQAHTIIHSIRIKCLRILLDFVSLHFLCFLHYVKIHATYPSFSYVYWRFYCEQKYFSYFEEEYKIKAKKIGLLMLYIYLWSNAALDIQIKSPFCLLFLLLMASV